MPADRFVNEILFYGNPDSVDLESDCLDAHAYIKLNVQHTKELHCLLIISISPISYVW